MSASSPPRPMPSTAGLTPLMRQYLGAKSEHPDCVLLFRMGDFWETFYEDAVLVSEVLGIALTSRGLERGERVPLAGVPLSAFEPSVAKLVQAGHRVAVCDQVEDPKTAKGIVRREVVEVLSAGTATLPGLLTERESRWLVALLPDAEAGRTGIARCDVSTGEFLASEVATEALAEELDRISPAEILLPEGDLAPAVSKAVRRPAALQRLPATRFAHATEAMRHLESSPDWRPPEPARRSCRSPRRRLRRSWVISKGCARRRGGSCVRSRSRSARTR